MVIPSEINAELPDSYYKDEVHSFKYYQWKIVQRSYDSLELSKEAISGLNLENSEAKKKIENAWQLRGKFESSYRESRGNLEQVESLIKNNQYQNSYNKLLSNVKQLYVTKDNLYSLVSEIKEARDLEKQYQEDSRFCFLFWCTEVKNTYSKLDGKIGNHELFLNQIENYLKNIESYKISTLQSLQKDEINLKNQEIQNLENLRKQEQYEADRQEQLLQGQIRQER